MVSAVVNPCLRSLAVSLEADDGAPRKLHSIVSVVGMEDDDRRFRAGRRHPEESPRRRSLCGFAGGRE